MKTYNLDEIFEIAEQIERNGAAFYRRAAELAAERDAAGLLLKLAAQEEDHEKTFVELREALVPEDRRVERHDQDQTVRHYLQALAGEYIFRKDTPPGDMLKGSEDMRDILDMAIQREKDSIVFYVGLVDTLPRPGDREKVSHIIREEQSHLACLSDEKKRSTGVK